MEFKIFETTADYLESYLHRELKKDFTMKMAKETDFADTENFICKF